MSVPTLVTFIAYFIVLFGIGFYFYRRSANIEDYLLGGRGMGSWVTALSAQASDMSGWLLMGLPGAIYLGGMGKTWIAIGLFIGTVLNWKLVELSNTMYEIVPGFIANCLTIFLVNLFIGQKDQSVLKEFDDVVSKIRSV